MKVLATGATGQYAHHVVTALVAHGIDVRGVVHDATKADEARRAGATEAVRVDLADTDGVAQALDGLDGVFLITPAFHPDATSMALNVVAAAIDAGVEKLVYNGVYHPSLSLSNHAGTRPVEEAPYASDLDFTVLQPAMYVQALEGTYRSALETGAVVAPWSKHSAPKPSRAVAQAQQTRKIARAARDRAKATRRASSATLAASSRPAH